MSSSRVFVTWNDSRRSTSLCARLGIDRVVIVAKRRGLARHVLGSLATVFFLIRRRPKVVWFQFSLALAVVLRLYASVRPRANVQLVADLHTKAMRRSGPYGAMWLVRLAKRKALQRCAAVLVTNPENARYAYEQLGAQASVLPDPLPESPGPGARLRDLLGDPPDVAFICSFAADEPISLMIETARHLRGEARIVFTGHPGGVRSSDRKAIERVARFTGFLPDDAYWELLRSTTCIVVLSDEPACLPCGAYESIAVGKRPIIADDTSARELFGDLAVYAPLKTQALTGAIRRLLEERSKPTESTIMDAYEGRWQKNWAHVQRRLAESGLSDVHQCPPSEGPVCSTRKMMAPHDGGATHVPQSGRNS